MCSVQRIRLEPLICKVNFETIYKSFTRHLTKCIDPRHVIFVIVYTFCRLLFVCIYIHIYLTMYFSSCCWECKYKSQMFGVMKEASLTTLWIWIMLSNADGWLAECVIHLVQGDVATGYGNHSMEMRPVPNCTLHSWGIYCRTCWSLKSKPISH